MASRQAPLPHTNSALDAVAADLQRLRVEAGAVSYAELASRITARRAAEGATAAAARVARSTIFDAFQTGRRRINAALVSEIVRALGADEDEAERWRQRCLDALAADAMRSDAQEAGEAASPVTDPSAAAETARHPRPVTDPGAARADDVTEPATDPAMRMPDVPVAADVPAPADDAAPSIHLLRTALVIALLVACAGLNLFGGTVVARLGLPLFLDMIGTATAAFALGPWWGVLVALATNAFAAVTSTPETIVFALVNVTGALVWGYGIRRFARTIPRFVLLALAAALACSLVAVPINALLYGGAYPGHASAALAAAWNADGDRLLAVSFIANVTASIPDKLIASFAALALARRLTPLRLRGEDPSQTPALLAPRRGR